MDPDELIEVAPGGSKRLADCTLEYLRGVLELIEAENADLRVGVESARRLFDDLDARGGDE